MIDDIWDYEAKNPGNYEDVMNFPGVPKELYVPVCFRVPSLDILENTPPLVADGSETRGVFSSYGLFHFSDAPLQGGLFSRISSNWIH